MLNSNTMSTQKRVAKPVKLRNTPATTSETTPTTTTEKSVDVPKTQSVTPVVKREEVPKVPPVEVSTHSDVKNLVSEPSESSEDKLQKSQDLQKSSNKRRQTSKAIGISISTARVRRHLDRLNLNHLFDSKINEYNTQLKEYKVAKEVVETGKLPPSEQQDFDAKKLNGEKVDLAEYLAKYKAAFDKLTLEVSELEMKLSALRQERIRFSNDAPVALSIICDELIKQLTDHTVVRALAAKKKIIQIRHLHEEGVEKLSLYPLIKTLPSFVATSQQLAKKLNKESQETDKPLKGVEKESTKKKKHMDKNSTTDMPKFKVEEVEYDDNDGESKTSFKFYVGLVCHNLITNEPKYAKTVRISAEIREYLSNLLVEFIRRLASLIRLTAASCMKNKTVNNVAVLRTVEALLIDGHVTLETIEYKKAQHYEPTALAVETEKRDKEKEEGRKYKIDWSKIPMVDGEGLVAVRTFSYPTSGFPALEEKVHEKLKLYDELVKKNKTNYGSESEDENEQKVEGKV